eukprot:TRINITY_DN6764_c0_g1_i1.p1 TRINITY_DN6764_c0_g1~~TRINITY_DN6764_c0_g1_i1.p1  ORF type:complete len:473 (+),score=83.86 TRINITY_DN6764_c0_g1_i1:67-1485(+)
MGLCEIHIDELIAKPNTTQDYWLDIKDIKNQSKGKLHIQLTLKDKKTLEKWFWYGFVRHFDINNDGLISREELAALLASIESDFKEEEVADMFDKFDANKDGVISYDEFYTLVSASDNPLKSKINNLLIWETALIVYDRDDDSIGSIVLQKRFCDTVAKKGKHKTADDRILVQDRETGTILTEKIPSYIQTAMRLMYATGGGKWVVDKGAVRKILKHLTYQQGKKYSTKESKREIPVFIKFHKLNMDEALNSNPDSYATFNEFFYRKLKPTVRKVTAPEDPKIAVSPADCRLHVFPSLPIAQELWIKGKAFGLPSLLQDPKLEKQYEGCSIVIARLAPQDYHRFHVPVDGIIAERKNPLGNAYFTVNPIAIRNVIDVYSENKRVISLIKTKEFGDVLFIAIGATMVGSIQHTVEVGATVKKGDEYGYFAFGGSTVLLLFEKGRIEFDEDLLLNSSKQLETLVKVGQSLGKAK